MAKSTSKLKLKAKPDLTEYRIWWIDPEDFEHIYDKHLMSPTGHEIAHDPKLMPQFVYDELVDLMWEDRYKHVGLSIPDEYGFITRADWGDTMAIVGQNMLKQEVIGDVGILMRKRDVTDFMRRNGFITDHLVNGEEIVTQHSKDVQVVTKSKKPTKTLQERMEQFDQDVKAITAPVKKPWNSGVVGIAETIKPLGKRVADLEKLVQSLTVNTRQPMFNIEQYGIWWLTHTELSDLVSAIELIDINDDTDHLERNMIDFVYSCGDELKNGLLDAINDDAVGTVTIPQGYGIGPGTWMDHGGELVANHPSLTGRYGVAFKVSSMGPILWTGILDQYGRCTDHKENFREDFGQDRKKLPLVEPPSDDIERDCCDAKETFAVWWLTQDQNKIVNMGIRDGSINLPGYIADEIRRYEDCVVTGKVSVHESFPKEVTEILDEHDDGNVEEAHLNGIVLKTIDTPNVEKYCGILTTLDMRTFSTETHMEEELAIYKKPYTNEEMRELFLQHIRGLIDYWADVHPKSGKEAASGVAHSICAAIAGCTLNLPGFLLVPYSTQEDADYMMHTGERPWPVLETTLVNSLPDAGNGLNSFLYQKDIPIPKCHLWLTQKEWFAGERSGRWAWITEVMIRETPFIRARFDVEHPGVVLANAYRDLCALCLKHGAFFVPEEWDDTSSTYSFKWATDDADVFDNMLKELSGYTIRGHF